MGGYQVFVYKMDPQMSSNKFTSKTKKLAI